MWFLLCNPTSGGGKGARYRDIVTAFLSERKIQYIDISDTTYEKASQNLGTVVKRGKAEISGVIVIGGDGMVHLAVQHLAFTEIPLLLIPAGTGNDFARTLGLPLDEPLVTLEKCLMTSAQSVDLGKVNEKFFAEILSTGFDSVVNERANHMKLFRGRIKYNIAILLELSTFKPRDYRFQVDSLSFSTKAMLIAIANGISYGGGMKVTPSAKLDDALFDIMILGPISKIEFLKVFPKVFSGGHVHHPAVQILQGKVVTIESDAVAYADGERIGQLPVRAEVLPNALFTWRL